MVAQHIIDEIQTRTRLSEIVGEKVQLQKKGGRSGYMGLCPFHKEKTPSFTVQDDKGFYHCFGCHEHGDAIEFLRKARGLGFMEAVEYLANRAGVTLPKESKQDKEEEQRYKRGYQLMEEACLFFEEQLKRDSAAPIRHYLKERTIDTPIIQRFRLGYAPNHNTELTHHLKSKGYAEKELIESGLTGQGKYEAYDYFRDRIIFPIKNKKGQVIAFGGRIVTEKEKAPKYLNSPEMFLFKKRHVLYNEDYAREPAYQHDQLVVAEGYMDVIALYQAGIEHAVAPLGTAITIDHVKRLWRYTDVPTLCFDGDTAGQRAMERIMVEVLPLLTTNRLLQCVSLPKGMDPDDIRRRDGNAKLQALLKEAMPLSQLLWKSEHSKMTQTTPEAWAALEKRLNEKISKIKDSVLQHSFKQAFRDKIWHLRSGKPSHIRPIQRQKLAPASTTLNLGSLEGSFNVICSFLLNKPHLLRDAGIVEQFIHLEPQNEEQRNVQQLLVECSEEEGKLVPERLDYRLEKNQLGRYIEARQKALMAFLPGDTEDRESVIWEYLTLHYQKHLLRQEYQELLNELDQVHTERAQMLEQELQQAEMRIRHLQHRFLEP